MNSPMLSSKLTALETTMCGKMMVITSYFKDEFQLIAIAIDLCTVERYSPKKRNQSVALLLMKLQRYYPFIPQIYSYVRPLYSNIECS